MLIAGINDGHNGSVVLLRDGRVVFAWQEERATRVKNQPGFPREALRRGLLEAGAGLGDVDIFAVASTRPISIPATLEENVRGYVMRNRSLRGRLRAFLRETPVAGWVYGYRQAAREKALVDLGLPPDRTAYFDHHLCHGAAALLGSGLSDRALVITCDGAGDGLAGTVSVAEGGRLRRLAAIPEKDSIGLLYTTATVLMGMTPNEHEYKVMGLAPYGSGPAAEGLAADLRRWIAPIHPGDLVYRRAHAAPPFTACYEPLRALTELHRFDHIAAAVQAFLEGVLADWISSCVEATGIRTVLLAGGVFMNVKANQRLLELPGVERLFIVPSCGDETNAFGAAWLAHAAREGAPPEPFGPLYLGPGVGDEEARKISRALDGDDRFQVFEPADIEEAVADLLVRGEVVARVSGREEFGARALGNRSLLADPASPGVVREINAAIKCRDFWMPFACSVLEECAGDYLENPKGMRAPWMIITFDCTSRWPEIQAGIHPHDRTVRPQIVSRADNPGFHRLLEAFRRRTGRGALLNTSYNIHGEPLVSSAGEAVDVLGRSGLRWLALGPFLIHKRSR